MDQAPSRRLNRRVTYSAGQCLGAVAACAGTWCAILIASLGGATLALAQPIEAAKPTDPKPPIPQQDPPKTLDDPARPKDDKPAEPPEAVPDEPEFPISKFELKFASEHPKLPSLEEVSAGAIVMLARVDGGFVLPGEGRPAVRFTFAELNASLAQETPPKFSRRALREALLALVREFNRRGLIGMIAEVDADDLLVGVDNGVEVWTDLRSEEGRTTLRVRVYAAIVTSLRTVAAGDRISQDKVNNPVHDRVRRNSPVQPEVEGDTDRRDLLRKDLVDAYVLRLNRVQGRRVDVAISGGENPGEVTLDYLVRESNPLLVYAQVSNTGTKETNVWRERLGLQWAQVSDNDDVFSLDYVTAGFTAAHILNGSYEFPVAAEGRVRARLFGSYSQFDASEVGISAENFSGRSFIIGGELSWNFAQVREVFVDVVGGLRYQDVFVDNQTALISGRTGFFIPSIGLRLERNTEEATTSIGVHLEGNIAGVATDASKLNTLGRLQTTDSWVLLTFNAEQTLFLEPIFDAENYRLGKSTLAHEIALSLRGQAAFNNRLVPNFEQIAGGLYSVRGYPESVAAGDTVIIASAEYRLHIPRLLAIQEEPGEFLGKSFRWSPQQAYARPDWDLIVRAFVDCARTINSQRLPFERDATLVGTGVGVELVYRRNLSVRVDWGVVIEPVTGKANRGDNRFHVVATLLF